MNTLRPLAVLPLAFSLVAAAQLPLVDITLVDNGSNELEVRLRPDDNFNGLFSSIAFTIRWETASGANLDNVSQVMPVQAYIPTDKAGVEEDDGGYRYQIFAGFGFSALSNFGASWTPGTEVVLMTIPVLNGTSSFQIADDAWTTTHNGDFFVSLNGEDQTGVIYQTAMGIDMGPSGALLTVLPNPADGSTVITLAMPGVGDVRLRLINAAGQQVWQAEHKAFSGTLRETLDLRPYARGTYMLRVEAGDELRTQRLVLK